MEDGMKVNNEQEIRNAECIILGLLSREAQNRYTIFQALNGKKQIALLALRNLEDRQLITTYIINGRRNYHITSEGEAQLDAWLTSPLTNEEMLLNREIPMVRFLFAEGRMPAEDVLTWLNDYETQVEYYMQLFDCWTQPEVLSKHQQLVLDATRMEIEMQHQWIQRARGSLMASDPAQPEIA
jgi:DNA-binding PadR family transcriptional regulator